MDQGHLSGLHFDLTGVWRLLVDDFEAVSSRDEVCEAEGADLVCSDPLDIVATRANEENLGA